MTPLVLGENDPPVEYALPDAVGEALAVSGIVTATRSLTPGCWTVAAAGRVGVARVGDLEVWIRPKVPIRRLVFLVGYALDPKAWQDSDVPVTEAPDLLGAIATPFARQADRAMQRGVLQGYRVVEDALPVLRGRIREAEQMRRRHGLVVPLEVRYDEYAADIAENRLLRAAAERLLRVPRVDVSTRGVLRRLLLRLADVSGLVRGQPLPRWQPTRLNARYHVALRLAEVVLSGQSFEQQRGRVRVSGFLFNLAKVFEDFVGVALREALTGHGGRVDFQSGHHLDVAGRVRMRPDVVWRHHADVRAVVDAKYKAEKPAGFPDADLYQMLAYCTALHLPRGHLVYAAGNEVPARHQVRRGLDSAGVEIVCHALDLDVEPAALLDQVRRLAAEIAGDAPAAAAVTA